MIEDVRLHSMFNSKGNRSVLVKVKTENGIFSASVPSGTSTGENEAVELSMDKVRKAFPNIRKAIIGRDEDVKNIDRILREVDATKNFSMIGGNLSLAVSIAVAKAQSKGMLWRMEGLGKSQYFPLPVCNVIGGGLHGGGTAFQEFLVIPYKARDPADAFQNVVDIWKVVGEELKKKKIFLGRNIENAWMSSMDDEKTLEFLSTVCSDWHVKIGVDVAASSFFRNGKYNAFSKAGLGPRELLDKIKELAEKYGIYYIEDPFHENAFESFRLLSASLRGRHLIVGDDLYCTNPRRIEKGITERSSNGIIIKPNQIRTVSQAGLVTKTAIKHGMTPIASHRSGETEDTWLSDLAIAWEMPLIKIGVLGADTPKHNRLIELWEEVPDPKMANLPH